MSSSRTYLIIAAVAASAVLAAGCSSSSKSPASSPTTGSSGSSPTSATGASTNTASAPGVTADTVKVGFITALTGNASSTFSDSEDGAKAYFDAVNAQGGINGRKITLVAEDDQSSPTGDLTATQQLLSQDVYAIINFSPYAFGGYKAAQAAGVPVVGGGFDGPEWGEQPNTNMFTYTGGYDPKYPSNTLIANFFKDVGATDVGALAYGVSPSSTDSIKAFKNGLEAVGLKMGYENLSVPFGGVDVTSYVLAMKQAGVDGAACSCVQSTNIALFTGLKQAGVNTKADLSFSGADSSIFDSATSTAAAQGTYYGTSFPPLDLNNSATNTLVANVKAADPSYKGGYPSYGLTGSYLSAVLLAKGLDVAGQNPTRASFISNLSQVTGFTANGLLASPVSFNHFGTQEQTSCQYFVVVKGETFNTINGGKPICGTLIPNSDVGG